MAGQDYLCWTRMQAEAGQPLDRIVARKDVERRAGDGVFAWGVGNPPSLAASALAKIGTGVDVVFSVMKGRPKEVDLRPSRVAVWRRFLDCDGTMRELPPASLVTSRADSASGLKRHHAALLCRSDAPLRLDLDGPPFDPEAFVNLSGEGRPVGASQVTALLRRVREDGAGSAYRANMRATLTGGYWVKLIDPVLLSASRLQELDAFASGDEDEWRDLVSFLRADACPRASRPVAAPELALL
jgi:hypothetical protein